VYAAKKLPTKRVIDEFRKDNEKPNIRLSKRIGLYNWHKHKCRIITRGLFRLRPGHNRLNGHLARFNSSISSICHDCNEEDEIRKHVILNSPTKISERKKIHRYFNKHRNFNFNIETSTAIQSPRSPGFSKTSATYKNQQESSIDISQSTYSPKTQSLYYSPPQQRTKLKPKQPPAAKNQNKICSQVGCQVWQQRIAKYGCFLGSL
jgi:hypothetical protein